MRVCANPDPHPHIVPAITNAEANLHMNTDTHAVHIALPLQAQKHNRKENTVTIWYTCAQWNSAAHNSRDSMLNNLPHAHICIHAYFHTLTHPRRGEQHTFMHTDTLTHNGTAQHNSMDSKLKNTATNTHTCIYVPIYKSFQEWTCTWDHKTIPSHPAGVHQGHRMKQTHMMFMNRHTGM